MLWMSSGFFRLGPPPMLMKRAFYGTGGDEINEPRGPLREGWIGRAGSPAASEPRLRADAARGSCGVRLLRPLRALDGVLEDDPVRLRPHHLALEGVSLDL